MKIPLIQSTKIFMIGKTQSMNMSVYTSRKQDYYLLVKFLLSFACEPAGMSSFLLNHFMSFFAYVYFFIFYILDLVAWTHSLT